MSTTYSICCPSKKLKLWIGQRNYLYQGDDYIPKLARFLYATVGEPLIFVPNEYTEDDWFLDCEEFEKNLPRKPSGS